MDEITRLLYENELPKDINGNTRNILLRQFQKLKGIDFVPQNVSNNIKWSQLQPMMEIQPIIDST